MEQGRRDLREYGKSYHLWKNGDYLGVAIWTNDMNVVNAFVQETCTGDKVLDPDEWQLIKEDYDGMGFMHLFRVS